MFTPDDTTIAFIGTGTMGCPMAGHLLDAGYDLVVYNRTRERAEPLVEHGARWADTVAAAVATAQVVITMVGYPEDVEDLYLGSDGIVDSAVPGSYLIDMSTSSPKLARELHAMGAINDLHVLDCPVTGGDIGAKEARLTVFVGGEKEDLAELEPVLRCMSAKISYQGIAGTGQLAKLANQIALAGCMLGAMEAIAFSSTVGLDTGLIADALKGGTADSWVVDNLVPKVLADDYTPGFLASHFQKDLGLALEVADDMDLTLPGLETAYQLYDLLCMVGGQEFGTQGLALIYGDEETCAEHGLDWSRADYDDFDDYDDEDEDDYDDEGYHGPSQHRHGMGGTSFGMGSFFSPN